MSAWPGGGGPRNIGGRQGADRVMAARMALAAAEANARIARCHEEVACPACGAPVGTRCRQLRSRMGKTHAITDSEMKHPHRRRWTLVVPAR